MGNNNSNKIKKSYESLFSLVNPVIVLIILDSLFSIITILISSSVLLVIEIYLTKIKK